MVAQRDFFSALLTLIVILGQKTQMKGFFLINIKSTADQAIEVCTSS